MTEQETQAELVTISQGFERLNQLAKRKRDRAEAKKLVDEFESSDKLCNEMGGELNEYRGDLEDGEERRRLRERIPEGCEILFCGYLEGDLSERFRLSNPIAFSGGFLLRTPVANILVDPGMGTLSALAERRFSMWDIDLILVSHHHPSASFELHDVLNCVGGYTPGRARDSKQQHKVRLLATDAVVNGRNGYPSLLLPPDRESIQGKPTVASPNKRFRFFRTANHRLGVEEITADTERADGKSVIITCLTARHKEAPIREKPGKVKKDGEPDGTDKSQITLRDHDGEAGKAVCSYFIECEDEEWSVLFTGDTEYDTNLLSWRNEKAYHKPTVLIANTKTLSYLPQHTLSESLCPNNPDSLWKTMHPTKNQLGWLGTLGLTRALKPDVLVMRALGLECVVRKEKGRFVYAPERLSVYQAAMESQLADNNCADTQVMIPGRLLLTLSSAGTLARTTHAPAFFPYGALTVGKRYVTNDLRQIVEIKRQISTLSALYKYNKARYTVWERNSADDPSRTDPEFFRPAFLIIQGDTGIGKTVLARGIGEEILGPTSLEMVHEYDLAAMHQNIVMSDIFGTVEGAFSFAAARPGLLAEPGVIILNNMEKLSWHHTKSLLDALENWKFRRQGETRSAAMQPIRAVVIFTTNKDILSSEDVADDVTYRMLKNAMTLPSLDSLTEKKREHLLSLVVSKWCEEHHTTMGSEAFELLARKTDWEAIGSLRALRNALIKARDITLHSYPQAYVEQKGAGGEPLEVNCHVDTPTVRAALEAVSAGPRTPKEDGGETTGKLPESLFWPIITLLSVGDQKGAFLHLRGQKAAGRDSKVAKSGFLTWVRPILTHLPASANQSPGAFADALWDLLQLGQRGNYTGPDALLDYCRNLHDQRVLALEDEKIEGDRWRTHLREMWFREVDSNGLEVRGPEFCVRLDKLGQDLRDTSDDELKRRCCDILWKRILKARTGANT